MFKAVQIFRGGNRWCMHQGDTLSEAVWWLDGTEKGELIEVDEPVEGVKLEVKLADVVFGEWIISNPRRLTMAKVEKAVKEGNAKSRAADLIGDDDKPTRNAGKKPAAGTTVGRGVSKAAKPTNVVEARSTFTDDQAIIVKKDDYAPRGDSTREKAWNMIRKAKTIKELRKARAKAGLGENTGGVFASLVKNGVVAVK
jgi:hypothetical protein